MNEVQIQRIRLLGLLPLSLFLLRFVEYAFILKTPVHILWSCHISNFILAIGLFFANPSLVRVSSYLLIMGVFPWLIDMFAVGEVNFMSIITHLAAAILAVGILRFVGIVKGDWRYAMLFFIVLQQITKFITDSDPSMNINLAHYAYGSLRDKFGSYIEYWLCATSITGFLVWSVERLGLTLLHSRAEK